MMQSYLKFLKTLVEIFWSTIISILAMQFRSRLKQNFIERKTVFYCNEFNCIESDILVS